MTPHLLLVVPVLLALVLYNTAFKNGKPICDNYILNVYIYAVFYLSLLGYFITLLMKMNVKWTRLSLGMYILLLIINIGAYLGILFVSKNQVLLKHLLSLLYILSGSVFLVILFAFFFPESIILSIGLTILLFTILTLFVWKYQDLISSRISIPLVVVFIILAIAEFVIQIMFPGSMLEKAIILIMLMVICYFLLVKTKRMIENEKTCVKDEGPDYVRESIGLVLTIENILARILSLFGRKRRRINNL